MKCIPSEKTNVLIVDVPTYLGSYWFYYHFIRRHLASYYTKIVLQ